MNATHVVLPALPSLPLDERGDLPDTAAIYFVLAGDAVLYIGQSVSLRQRWLAHHRLAQLNEYGGCRIAWMTVDDAGLLDALEQACIAHFEPVLNGEVIPRLTGLGEPGETSMARRRTENPLDRNVTLRMSQDLYARIDRIAERRGLTIGPVVRQMLERAVERAEKEDGK